MSKPLLGLILGAVLGAIDGTTALFTPEAFPKIGEIIMYSTIKSLVGGFIIGLFARKVISIKGGMAFGFGMGLLLAFLVSIAPDEAGNHYWVEIMVPGSIVGLILGYATQKFGKPAVLPLKQIN